MPMPLVLGLPLLPMNPFGWVLEFQEALGLLSLAAVGDFDFANRRS